MVWVHPTPFSAVGRWHQDPNPLRRVCRESLLLLERGWAPRVGTGWGFCLLGVTRDIPNPPSKARKAWMATLGRAPSLLQAGNVPQHPPAASPRVHRRAEHAAAPRIINNQSLVKLFGQIYTFLRPAEGRAGAAAAPLDGRIHHGL